MDFTKKFNVGVTLDTSLSEFKKFLEEYHGYIHSVFFSPPVSRYFHTRSIVANEFLIPGKRRQFWKMLELIGEYGIELELLLNTLRLDKPLIEKARTALDRHGIDVSSVCFMKDYYDSVTEYFPDKKYIFSFNNGFQRKSEIDEVIDGYRSDVFVLGSLFIRNNEFFSYLRSRGKDTYLLLNNACSFNCGTCNNVQSVCDRAFYENLKKHTVEYLYALQSIFPFELSDGTIDTSNIGCFKVSNRSSNLKFLRGALDSYITGEIRSYLKKDKNNYAYWGRAGYFWKFFNSMDLDRILEYKKEIFGKRRDKYQGVLTDGNE